MKIYLASNFHDYPRMELYRGILEKRGHEIISRWHRLGEKHKMLDGGENREMNALLGLHNLEDLTASKVLISFSEKENHGKSRGGKHIEFGFFTAMIRFQRVISIMGGPTPTTIENIGGKFSALRLILIGDHENTFHYMDHVEYYPDFEALLTSGKL